MRKTKIICTLGPATKDDEVLKQLMENGMYLSYRENNPEQTVRTMPVDRMFLETDDSPVDIEEVLHRVARTRGTDVEELRQAIRENIQKVFFRH